LAAGGAADIDRADITLLAGFSTVKTIAIKHG
jgi:hypothetical protein